MIHAILISLLALPLMAADQPAADPALKATLDQVNATGASLMPVSADGQTYRFTALNVAKEFVDAGLAPLGPIAAKISSLDLAKTKVTDAGLKALAGFKNLKELHLEGTGISDAGLDHLKGLTSLEYLNLYNTKVTDAGLSKLTGLTKIKSLYLWQTGVTKAGVALLKGKLSGAHINTGWSAEDDAKPVATAAAAPAPLAKPAAAPATAPTAGGKLDPVIAAKAIVYKDVIAPIMQAKCVACHGAEKKKGKLQLHEFAAIMKGGGDGATTVIPKNTKDSLMLTRINLASDDDDHMPPSDEPQVTKEELALLKWWIETGASDSSTVAAAKPTPEVEAALAAMLGKGLAKTQAPAAAAKVEKPKTKPLSDAEKKQVAEISAKMQALNASLMPLAQDTEQLRLSVINAADKFGDKELAMLEPIAAQIVWVDLARSQITDAANATLAKLVNLERLHLENTKITDVALAGLGSLKALEYINLYGTKTTDAGLTKLSGIKSLKKVFVWQTGVTRAAATALEGQIPGLKVNVGLSDAEIAKLTTPPPAPPAAPAKKEAPKKAEATKTPAKPAAKPASTPAAPIKPEVKPATATAVK
jgi:cytochrome c553